MSDVPWQNFLRHEIGYERSWPVTFDLAPLASQLGSWPPPAETGARRIYSRWTRVADGPRPTVEIYPRPSKRLILPLDFSSRGDLREVRDWLRQAPQPLLQRFEGSVRPDLTGDGVLRMSRTAFPERLSECPEIVLEELALLGETNAAAPLVLERLADDCALPTPDGILMVVSTPVILGSAATAEAGGGSPPIIVHLAGRDALHCRIHGPPGAQFLLAERVQRGVEPFLQDARLIAVPGRPKLLDSRQAVRGADLSRLLSREHPFLRAWVEYERVARDCGLAQLERRRAHPLEYDGIEDLAETGQWHVVLANGADALEFWLDATVKDRRRATRLDAMVEVRALEGDETVAARLLGLFDREGRVRAALKLQGAQSVLPHRGKIMVVEDRGERRQAERRERALSRLRTGASACPNLLQYVFDPETVPSVGRPSGGYHRRPGSRPLTETQQAAVIGAAKEPGLFLIQGPPGTGKTQVIVETIHELRRRYRRRVAEQGRPLRVLVTSIQTEAVANALRRMQDEQLEVNFVTSDEAKEKEFSLQLLTQARGIADRLCQRLRDDGNFQHYARLVNLRERFRSLRARVITEGLGPPAVRELGELLSGQDAVALTDRLRAELRSLHERVCSAVARAEGDEPGDGGSQAGGDAGSGPRAATDALASDLRRLAELSDDLCVEDLPPVSELLGRIIESVGAASVPVSVEALKLGERCRVLRARARAAARRQVVHGDLLAAWQALLANARQHLLATANEVTERETAGMVSNISATATSTMPDSALAVTITTTAVAAAADTSTDPGDARETRGEGGDGVSHSRTRPLEQETVTLLAQALNHVTEHLALLDAHEAAATYGWIKALSDEPARLQEIYRRHAPITTATCQKAEPAACDVREEDLYDVAIVDEAARAGVDLLIPLTLGRSVVLVGDQQQLPPHVEPFVLAQLEQGVLERVDLQRQSFFDWLRLRLPRENFVALTRQFRMHEHIGRLVSKVFYEPDGVVLEHHFADGRAHERLPHWGLFDDAPVVWVDTSDVLQGRGRQGYRWPCHERNDYEAEIITTILKAADPAELRRRQGEGTGRPVGVIPFYREQLEHLQARLLHLGRELESLVDTGTVDSFQGKEYPLVILSTVRSNDRGQIGFLRLPQRVNVAISRAQRQLVIVGDSRTVAAEPQAGEEVPPLARIFDLLRRGETPGRIVPSREVLR